MPPLGWAQIIAFIAALDSAALQKGLPESHANGLEPWMLQRSVVGASMYIISLHILELDGLSIRCNPKDWQC